MSETSWVRAGSSKDERKVNASTVQIGDRVVIKVYEAGDSELADDILNLLGATRAIGPSRTKTGEKVYVTTVTAKEKRIDRRGYQITTGQGSFYAEPVQTMWKAQEDAAGIKRAHAEAIEEDIDREAAKTIEAANEVEAEEAAQLTERDGDGPSPVRETTGSAVVRLLEKVHARIRQNHPEVPEVVIVTGAGTTSLGGKWGHFRARGWTAKDEQATTIHEMFMAGETLAKGARQVLQTMLHESVHAVAEARGKQDTSRQGRWHNQIFLAIAQEMGLEYLAAKANPQIGYSEVTLTEATKAEYADLLTALDDEIHLMVQLPFWLGGTTGTGEEGEGGGENMGRRPAGGESTSNSNNLKLTCGCDEPNIIRASKKVADKMVVNCGDCDELFQVR